MAVRLREELDTLRNLIGIYCRGNHNKNKALCASCTALFDYASERLDRCPYGSMKPACSRCTIHCYQPEYRELVRQVMRYSGPRLILHKPLVFAKYIIRKVKK